MFGRSKINKETTKEPLPEFKTQAEENEFWKKHDYGEYLIDSDEPAQYFQTKDNKGSSYLYAEKGMDDPKLTENVNVRFSKKTVEELRELAENDERTMASMIRRWVMQKLKEEKYERNS